MTQHMCFLWAWPPHCHPLLFKDKYVSLWHFFCLVSLYSILVLSTLPSGELATLQEKEVRFLGAKSNWIPVFNNV